MYDLLIIGGGPAGCAAGVYASRKRLQTVLVTPEWGGQSVVSPDIQNWIGSPTIAGHKLAQDLETHVKKYAGEHVTVTARQKVTPLKTNVGQHVATLSNDTTVTAKAVLVASGSARRRLDVTGSDTFEHKGLTYCASCDGPLFAGQSVAVIGGGNAGFETAAQLLAYAQSVTLLHRGNQYKADPVTVERVLAHEQMTGILNAQTTAVTGDNFVNGLTYKDTKTDTEHKLSANGVFVEIGMLPNTDFLPTSIDTDAFKRITIDPWTQKTSQPGVWAAGDCTNVRYHQNNISAGDAVRALEDIYVTLKTT